MTASIRFLCLLMITLGVSRADGHIDVPARLVRSSWSFESAHGPCGIEVMDMSAGKAPVVRILSHLKDTSILVGSDLFVHGYAPQVFASIKARCITVSFLQKSLAGVDAGSERTLSLLIDVDGFVSGTETMRPKSGATTSRKLSGGSLDRTGNLGGCQ